MTMFGFFYLSTAKPPCANFDQCYDDMTPGRKKEKISMPQENTEKKMTNCPRCGKPILNGGIFTSHARFTLRCPWCQATLEIHIQPKIVTEVVKLGNGEPYKAPTGPAPTERTAPILDESGLEGLFDRPKAQGFRLVGYLYPEQKE